MKKYNLSIEQVKKYNKEYNALVWKYVKAMSHIFDYPHPRVFGWFVNTDYDADLYNITDDHFKKMTYKECRDNKDEFNDICASNRYTVFWFNGKTKQLLAISRQGKIIQFGTQFVDTNNYSKRHAFPTNREHLDRMTQKEYLIDDIRVDILPDGTKLDWYRLSNTNYGAKQYGYNYINSHGMIFPRSGSGSYNPYVIGNPFVNTSPIRNKAEWDKDGYVIIYMPEEFMKDDEGRIKGPSFGIRSDYNSWKAQNSASRNEKRKDYAISSLYRKYKWNKDDNGNIIPYTLDGDRFTFEFDENGKAIATPVSSNLKYADAFNLRIRQKNVEHYRYLVKQKSSNKEVILFSKSIKDFCNKALKYLEKIEAVEDNYLDATEMTSALLQAFGKNPYPTVITSSRQAVVNLDSTSFEEAKKGAYVVYTPSKPAKNVIISCGTELATCIQAAKELEAKKVYATVVSMPSQFLFDQQSEEYKESILPKNLRKVAVEMGATMSWYKYADIVKGIDTFGASMPIDEIYGEYGFRVEDLVTYLKGVLKAN